ncbi:copper resistance protein B [Sphingomonas sp. RP10(2022)]|uniref:Copper resistance protein B n=1 Tax=Sphingomonas liriopis TaxID=2949094 RepID=A0A9X2KN99_9SPHN|nr:copper resistance protein B [Sphingomonas liriopis]MCP3733434.1 copper resistance protein B [Sphingomonas liriopis]
MRPLVLIATIATAAPAAAQMHDMRGMHMPGMTMPPPKKAPARPKPAKTAPARKTPRAANPKPAAMPGMDMTAPTPASCQPEHAAMGHCSPTPAATTADAPPNMPAGTDQPAGNAPPPAPPTTLAAARFYDPATMARANRTMRDEHGGMRFAQILFNLAEVQVRRGRDGYRWDGAGWFGGDIDRLVVKSEGEGGFGDRIDDAEVQALYSRAIDPYWNLQAGVRQDLGMGAHRTYATVGIEGLAPYWFDVEGALFLSDKGDLLARAEAWYDQRITQRLILQPRIELNLAAQDMPASRVGAGLSTAELGLRLRYEIKRELAPYVGVSWDGRYGATARYARSDGQDHGGVALALGLRTWF